ncbi:FAD-dependent oxidoreductase [Streptomyces sp. NPDC016459]|uniref:NAD(P)/FAD-dependent oxidoreductase n=1 Tax=Streptomyces sp. NPDC016459 TaxID=3157190 RepID=UPI0033DEB4AC
MSTAPQNIVVVGASLAGLRGVQALRAAGYRGRLTLVGAERHAPYDRPPLSKEFLAGRTGPTDISLEPAADLGLTELYGHRALHLDTTAQEVHLDDGSVLPYDGLLIATGAGARLWNSPRPRSGVHTIRTIDDARALKEDLTAARRRLLIVGAGFIGCEVASVARELDHEVTLVSTEPLLLQEALGHEAAAFLTQLHHDAGVEILPSSTVSALHGHERIEGCTVNSTWRIAADTALLALGARPHTDWLITSGLNTDRGLATDEYTRALRADGRPDHRVVAAGDITRFPHPHAPEPIQLGHWSNAVEQAQTAAHNLLNPHNPKAYRQVASFWTTQYGVRFRAVGLPRYADHTEVRELDPENKRLDIAYYRAGRLIGALTANRAARITAYQAALAEEISLADHAREPHHAT